MIRITFILCFFSLKLIAQDSTISILTYNAFMDRVKNHHPIAMQADIKLNQGDAYLRKARGNFDPKAYSDVSQKYFTDKQYPEKYYYDSV